MWAAASSCGGTLSPQSSDAKNTPTGTKITSSARMNTPVSSRERRGSAHSEASPPDTRVSSTQVMTPSAGPITAQISAPRDAHMTPVAIATAVIARTGTLTRLASRIEPARGRGSRPRGAKRRGSSWSCPPDMGGASV